MPYFFIDDDNYDKETMGEPADVVSREEYDTLIAERDELRTERDGAAVRIGELSDELQNVKDSYAKHVITAAQIVERASVDTQKDGYAQSFEELFSKRTSERN